MARLLAWTAAWIATVAAARADLLVLHGGSPGAGVVARLDPATGMALPSFGQDNEGMLALCVDAGGDIFVSADILGAGLIYRFDRTGKLQEKIADVPGTDFAALALGPDGTLCALASATDAAEAGTRRPAVVRFTAQGAREIFVRDLAAPRALAFGPDGSLYVADGASGVRRFDGRTGAARDTFAAIDAAALTFGPDGQLYAVDARTHAVRRFDGRTGAPLDTVVPGDVGARALAFGPDGDLYAATRSGVLRFDGRSGAYRGALGVAALRVAPRALAFVAARR